MSSFYRLWFDKVWSNIRSKLTISITDECKSVLDASAVTSHVDASWPLCQQTSSNIFLLPLSPYSDGSRLALMITSQPGWPSCQQTAPVSRWPQAENNYKIQFRELFNALGGTLVAWLSRPDLLWTWCTTLRSKAERSGFSRTAAFMRILHVFLSFSLFFFTGRFRRRSGEAPLLNWNRK